MAEMYKFLRVTTDDQKKLFAVKPLIDVLHGKTVTVQAPGVKFSGFSTTGELTKYSGLYRITEENNEFFFDAHHVAQIDVDCDGGLVIVLTKEAEHAKQIEELNGVELTDVTIPGQVIDELM